MKIIPVILSGGSGTRLWPLSRAQYPKQLLKLTSENTMIQETVLRLQGISNISEPIIVCNEKHRFVIAEQLSQIGIQKPTIILEPIAKNTAPAITVAATYAKENIKEDSILIVLPSDHSIKNKKAFHEALNIAIKEAENGNIVTFGICPTFAATGYGYINANSSDKSEKSYKINKFVEKPNLENAEKYLQSYKTNSDYFWNSGMFVFSAKTFLEEISKFNPEIVKNSIDALKNSNKDLDFIRLSMEDFSKNPSISVDYAVMEKTQCGKVVPLDAEWSDVGSWDSLWASLDKDENQNVIRGNVKLSDVENSIIFGSNRTITVKGLKNVVIADTKDAILISDRKKSEDVKTIVEKLQSENNPIAKENPFDYRPWGKYETIEEGSRFKVKHITVKPGQKLSVQMHYHRAEHWIIISGTAKVRNGDKELLLSENQSTFIPLGAIHSIENPGKLPLEFIEVQSGSYLGEDDIVRFNDLYGRN